TRHTSPPHSTLFPYTTLFRSLTSYQAVLFLAERGLDAECKTILRSLAEAAFSMSAIDKDEQFASKLLKANDYEDLQWMKKWNERSEEHTSELQSRGHLVCRLL